MQIQHKHLEVLRMGGLGALVGCMIAAAGCASGQETRRGHTTTAAEAREHRREVRTDRDRDGDGVRDSREVARNGEALDENVAVKPVAIASPSDVRDNVGDKETVRDNVRDGDANAADTDRQLTSRIRQSIVADDALSTKAKNVEIISKNGAVTLRGPVGTAAEKSRIESLAQDQAGAKRVTNQIEVAR